MACCAFAAFILSQIILGVDTLRARLGFKAGLSGPENPNALWTLGSAPALPKRPASLPVRWATVTAAAVCAGAGIGAVWFAGGHPEAFDAVSNWCRAVPEVFS